MAKCGSAEGRLLHAGLSGFGEVFIVSIVVLSQDFARPGESSTCVSQSEVDSWLEEIRSFGIRSIIYLLGDDQLSFYQQLPKDLISCYRDAGFEVEHVPARDYQRPPLSQEQLEKVWTAFAQQLPKPVIVHCSAGFDRTGQAVRYITQHLGYSG